MQVTAVGGDNTRDDMDIAVVTWVDGRAPGQGTTGKGKSEGN